MASSPLLWRETRNCQFQRWFRVPYSSPGYTPLKMEVWLTPRARRTCFTTRNLQIVVEINFLSQIKPFSIYTSLIASLDVWPTLFLASRAPPPTGSLVILDITLQQVLHKVYQSYKFLRYQILRIFLRWRGRLVRLLHTDNTVLKFMQKKVFKWRKFFVSCIDW